MAQVYDVTEPASRPVNRELLALPDGGKLEVFTFRTEADAQSYYEERNDFIDQELGA